MKTVERKYKDRIVKTITYSKDEAPNMEDFYGDEKTRILFKTLKDLGATKIELKCIEKGVYELNATLKYQAE